MRTGRRNFGKTVAYGFALLKLGAVTGATLFLTACSVSLEDILWYVGDASTAFQHIVALLEADGIVIAPALVNVVLAAFNAITQAITSFQANKPGSTLGDIVAALQDAIDAVQAFFSNSNIPESPILAVALLLASVILDTLAGFIQKFNVPASPHTAPVGPKVTLLPGRTIKITPTFRTCNQFIKDFNASCLKAGHPEAQLKAKKPSRFASIFHS